MWRRIRACGADRGSSTIELTAISIPLLLLMGVVVAWGMAGAADTGVSTAARAAARAASQSATAEEAQERGYAAAQRVLASHSRHCTGPRISIDTAGFSAPVGEPAQVSATVSCTVPLSRVAVPGMPGNRTISDSFVSTLDQYAERGP
jgi:Flp pilus assembly protein TadG